MSVQKFQYDVNNPVKSNSVTSSWSPPFINGTTKQSNINFVDNNDYVSGNSKFWGKPRPLKIWRKRLIPRIANKSTKDIGMPMDKPGGSTYLGLNTSHCETSGCKDSYILKEDIKKEPIAYNQIVNMSSCCQKDYNIVEKYNDIPTVNSYDSYLFSRAKKFNQRAGRGVEKFEDGYTIYPTDRNKNSTKYIYPESVLVYSAKYQDNDNNDNKKKQIKCNSKKSIDITPKPFIYKPSNQQFAVEGAVSGGSRIARLKENTVNKYYRNTLTANGLKNVNYGDLNIQAGSGYFIKVKSNYCKPKKPSGSHTLCWTTNKL